MRRVLWLTLGLNLLVAFAKVLYGQATGTLSIRADGYHSLTDAANNIIGLAGVWMAARPADEKHPYGHHKFEVVAAAFVGVALLVTAWEVVSSALLRLTSPDTPPPDPGNAAFVVLGVTLVVNLAVARYERRRGNELGSPFLLSDAAHTLSDSLVTIGVIVTTVLLRAGYAYWDAVTGLVIAGFIARAGLQVLRENLGYLVDRVQLDPRRVEATALEVDGVESVHKIRTRGTPQRVCVDLHIQLAPDITLAEAHRLTHAVINELKAQHAGVVDVVIHTEPAARTEEPNHD